MYYRVRTRSINGSGPVLGIPGFGIIHVGEVGAHRPGCKISQNHWITEYAQITEYANECCVMNIHEIAEIWPRLVTKKYKTPRAWVKPGSVYMHGSKPRLELNGPELAFLGGRGGGVVNSVSIKGRGLRAISAGLAPVPPTAFLSMNAKKRRA